MSSETDCGAVEGFGGGEGADLAVSEAATAVAADLSLSETESNLSKGEWTVNSRYYALFHPFAKTGSLVLVEDPDTRGLVCDKKIDKGNRTPRKKRRQFRASRVARQSPA